MFRRDDAPLLKLRDISVRFGFVDALKEVSLDVFSGEVVAIVGDNGAGKSTLVKVIGGLQTPSGGDIEYGGQPASIHSVHEANAIGIVSVFQGQEFCNNLDVSSNLFLGHELKDSHGMRDDESMNSKARQILQEFSSAIRVGQPISTLSVGQRQTVALARTLLNDPKLILLDEPTASLSVMQTAEVLNYIKRLRTQGRSVILIGHDLPDVFAVSDRIIVLRHGRINGIHETLETSYEQIIAEIAGVNGSSANLDSITSMNQYDNLMSRRTLIDRTMQFQAASTDESYGP
ncbi:monosaccharide ABC transporter ATP-binding protein, CUT2 family [Bifidobacterium bohemicum]|uniref:ABC transporter ATP-binding protein n=1 Tax=Bifidobacterium bohemicum DSM 22767 TaxID=1437606 RepID=A0A086ZJM8_9BIFI|nr:ATP-binding cassette domain-containing protein [Bifidobacterium bohemicum]KFI46728.1 ABC transporter ATP-binding protein [Bifidobacterium bohemicum DSM 22767]SCB79962.1 monosaccharide ABC transporter ATP-binding protein, CUT2 family [Bifidobacterium bohemicum]